MVPIKNILFDLGGIFINLDFSLTEIAFRNLGVTQFSEMFTQHHSNPLFEQLETGKLSETEFYENFRKQSGTNLTDKQIRTAWNALLLDFPPERLEWLNRIRQQYAVYLFSNTNIIHYQAFMEIYLQAAGKDDFNSLFRKAYYSHELGLRKPYPESFTQILTEQGLVPEETLFIDDTLKNIETARNLGMQTIHLVAPQSLLDLPL